MVTVWFSETTNIIVTYRRKIKDRMKTVSVALVLCLNIGVDPPDVIKPIPCARREAWVDPALMNMVKAAPKIALMLQKSYERLQPRARYKAAIDPTIDYLKKLCAGMRKVFEKDSIHQIASIETV